MKIVIQDLENYDYDDRTKHLKLHMPTNSFAVHLADYESLSAEETAEIAWIWDLIKGKHLAFTAAHKNPNFKESTVAVNPNLPKVYAGGGMAWLEPFRISEGPTNSTKHGIAVSLIGNPQVLGYEWRRYADDNNGEIISGLSKFGETIQLHIYTDGLYGQELNIQLIDNYLLREDLDIYEKENSVYKDLPDVEKGIDRNNLPSKSKIKNFEREVRVYPYIIINEIKQIYNFTSELETGSGEYYVQKCILDLLIDPVWSYHVNREKKPENNFLYIKPLFSMRNSDVELHSASSGKELIVEGLNEDFGSSPLYVAGNKAVLVDDDQIQTDPGHYHHCRYDAILGTYKRGEDSDVMVHVFPYKISPREYNKSFPVIAGVKKARTRLKIEVQDVNTDDCDFEQTDKDHKGRVIEYARIAALIKNGRGKSTDKKRLYDYLAQLKEQQGETSYTQSPDKSEIAQIFKFNTGNGTIKVQAAYRVLEEYKPFRTTIPTDELLEMELGYDYSWGGKIDPLVGLLYTFLPTIDAVVQKYPISVNSCVYSNPVDIDVYPDVKWTLQFAMNYDKDDFNALRGMYHEKWTTKQVAADKNVERLKGRKSNKKNKAKLKTAVQERNKVNKQLRPKDQAQSLISDMNLLTDLEMSLICEFDRPFAAMELSSMLGSLTDFIQKVGDFKEFIDSLINGSNPQTTKNSPKSTPKNQSRLHNLKNALSKKKSFTGRKKFKSEFLTPQLAFSISWCAQAAVDTQHPIMGNQFEAAIDLDPLIGYKLSYDLYHLLYKAKHPAVLAVVAALDILDEALGDNFDIKLDLTLSASINGLLKGTINTAKGSKWSKRLMVDDDNSPCKLDGKLEVSITGYVQANARVKSFLFDEVAVYGEMKAEITAGITISGQILADNNGLYLEPSVSFDGMVFSGEINLGAAKKEGDTGKDKSVAKLKEERGFHYTLEGKAIILDACKIWDSDLKIPLINFL